VKTEGGSVERVSGQIRLHVFLSYPFEFGVLRLRGENRAGEPERQQNYDKPEKEAIETPGAFLALLYIRLKPGVNEITDGGPHPASCSYRQCPALGVAKICS
jgi:hypothetical protein